MHLFWKSSLMLILWCCIWPIFHILFFSPLHVGLFILCKNSFVWFGFMSHPELMLEELLLLTSLLVWFVFPDLSSDPNHYGGTSSHAYLKIIPEQSVFFCDVCEAEIFNFYELSQSWTRSLWWLSLWSYFQFLSLNSSCGEFFFFFYPFRSHPVT